MHTKTVIVSNYSRSMRRICHICLFTVIGYWFGFNGCFTNVQYLIHLQILATSNMSSVDQQLQKDVMIEILTLTLILLATVTGSTGKYSLKIIRKCFTSPFVTEPCLSKFLQRFRHSIKGWLKEQYPLSTNTLILCYVGHR